MSCCGGKKTSQQADRIISVNRKDQIDLVALTKCSFCGGGMFVRLNNGQRMCMVCKQIKR